MPRTYGHDGFMSTRELLDRVEKASGRSGKWIAEQHLEITTQQYYKLKDQESFGLDLLAALARLPGVDPGELGRWVEELF